MTYTVYRQYSRLGSTMIYEKKSGEFTGNLPGLRTETDCGAAVCSGYEMCMCVSVYVQRLRLSAVAWTRCVS